MPANDRAVSTSSAKQTRKMPTAAGASFSTMSPADTLGTCSPGRPGGDRPRPPRRRRRRDRALPRPRWRRPRRASAAGTRGREAPAARSRTASATPPTATVAACASPSSLTTSTSCGTGSRASTSRPSIFWSWRDDQHDRDPVDGPHQHRARQVIGEPPDPRERARSRSTRPRAARAWPPARPASGLPAAAEASTCDGDERRDRAVRAEDTMTCREEPSNA